MLMKLGLRSAAAALAFTLAAASATAQEPARSTPPKTDERNVQLTITLGEVTKGPQKSYRVVGSLGKTARMIVGFRTPIPTARNNDDGGAAMAFVYQNVGMTAMLRPEQAEGGRLHVMGQLEVSGAKASEMAEGPQGMPIIGTFQQDIDVFVAPGKPLRLAEGPDPDGGQRFIELTVTLLD
jgi:hypothetical protein